MGGEGARVEASLVWRLLRSSGREVLVGWTRLRAVDSEQDGHSLGAERRCADEPTEESE